MTIPTDGCDWSSAHRRAAEPCNADRHHRVETDSRGSLLQQRSMHLDCCCTGQFGSVTKGNDNQLSPTPLFLYSIFLVIVQLTPEAFTGLYPRNLFYLLHYLQLTIYPGYKE